MPQDLPRDRAQRVAQPAIASGSLPPNAPDDRFATSNTSDVSRERLAAECRRLRDHMQVLSNNLESAMALMAQHSELHVQADQAVHDIEQDPTQFNRAVIIKAYQEWCQAKIALSGDQDMRDQLKAELENDRRCLDAVEMALTAVADAAFFSDDRRLVPIETGDHRSPPRADRRNRDDRDDVWDEDNWDDPRRDARDDPYRDARNDAYCDARDDPYRDARNDAYCDAGHDPYRDARDDAEWEEEDDPPPARDRRAPREDPPPRMTSAQLVEQETLLTAREYERHALARGIDERVRYALTDVVLQAEFCEAAIKSDPSHAGEVAAELKTRLGEILRETDMLIFELEPMMLSELGLAGTLHRYVDDLRASRGAPLVVRLVGKERRYHIAIERAVFRAAREAILNALRHSRASRVVVALTYYPDAMILSVEDDGIGFDVDDVMEHARRGFHSGFGQLCIEADVIGATLGLTSAPTLGTRLDYIITDAPGWLG